MKEHTRAGRPLPELAALAAQRLDALQQPPEAPPAAFDLDPVILQQLVRRHPDKSAAELAIVAARLMAAKARARPTQ